MITIMNTTMNTRTPRHSGGAGGGAAAQPSALTPSALAQVNPAMRRNMIGERLYPLIHQNEPTISEHWGKITGMLLDGMDTSELLHLIESPEALQAKVQETLNVLGIPIVFTANPRTGEVLKQHQLGRSHAPLRAGGGGAHAAGGDPPDAILCPITHDVMVDPVILRETNQTYDRTAIERWLEMNRSCPVTGVRLVDDPPQLVPNYAMRSAIEEIQRSAKHSAQMAADLASMKSAMKASVDAAMEAAAKAAAKAKAKAAAKAAEKAAEKAADLKAVPCPLHTFSPSPPARGPSPLCTGWCGQLRIWCETHQQLVCCDCTIGPTHPHCKCDYDFAPQMAQKFTPAIIEDVREAKTRVACIMDGVAAIVQVQTDLGEQTAATQAQVSQRFAVLRAKLNQREQEVVDAFSQASAQKMHVLEAQVEHALHITGVIQEAQLQMEGLLESVDAAPGQLLARKGALRHLLAQERQTPPVLEPQENAMLDFEDSGEIDDVVATFGDADMHRDQGGRIEGKDAGSVASADTRAGEGGYTAW